MQAGPQRGETNSVRSPSLQWDLLWPFLTVFEPSSKTTALPQHTQKHIFTRREYPVSQALPALAAERDYSQSGYSENSIIEI